MLSFLLVLALLAQAASGPDWRPLGPSGNGREALYDPASVTRSGPVTRVRLRFNDADSYALSTVELRCDSLEARVDGVVTYNPAGTEVSRNDIATPFRLISGGFLERLARDVCGAAAVPLSQ